MPSETADRAVSNPGPGLPPGAESVIADPPSEPFWCENLLFALYDPGSDIGFWLHLGTVPNDWTMWEERMLMLLPQGEGFLTMWSFHRTAPERRPAASNLEFRCIEPFRRWGVTFDGYAVHTTEDQMVAGASPPGERRRLVIDLDIDCVGGVWDAGTAASGSRGAGSLDSQGWAKEHYEQLFRVSGRVTAGPMEIDFDGVGWRDHSRGPRGSGSGATWGGHVIMGGLFPSGRGFILSRYWTPEGIVTLEGGGVVAEGGEMRYARVESAPRLTEFVMAGEPLPIGLSWDGGRVDLECVTRRSLWTPMRKKYAAAVDMTGTGLNYALNFSRCVWDGEEGWVYSERSEMLNQPAPHLRRGEVGR
jgi:hypothetical protein